ncbi:hypothetical protein [Steroidobacter cummioxidans]|uniref:hypothetical protein n=1 Tax=Steroidobacter cummioxidans TaxID=1803913 RepID=UPI0013795B3C|nr:hypothetical protein [Steroidobacter cummioxidans]
MELSATALVDFWTERDLTAADLYQLPAARVTLTKDHRVMSRSSLYPVFFEALLAGQM